MLVHYSCWPRASPAQGCMLTSLNFHDRSALRRQGGDLKLMVFFTIFTADLTNKPNSDTTPPFQNFCRFSFEEILKFMPPRVTRASRSPRARSRTFIGSKKISCIGLFFLFKFLTDLNSFFRMSTAEHLPSGWPFESSHYMSTFRTPQLGYCRHNVQPSSVHRKNNPHAALTDPWQYPDKVMYQRVTTVLEGPI